MLGLPNTILFFELEDVHSGMQRKCQSHLDATEDETLML